MADITLTFEGGKQHIYQNAPDTLSPDDVYSRAQKDFPDQKITGISRKVSGVEPRAEAPAHEYAAPVEPEIPQVRKAAEAVGARLGRQTRETRAPVLVPTAGQLARDYAAIAKATGAELGKQAVDLSYLMPPSLPLALMYGGQAKRRLETAEREATKQYPLAGPTAKALTTALSLYPYGLAAKAAPEIGAKAASKISEILKPSVTSENIINRVRQTGQDVTSAAAEEVQKVRGEKYIKLLRARDVASRQPVEATVNEAAARSEAKLANPDTGTDIAANRHVNSVLRSEAGKAIRAAQQKQETVGGEAFKNYIAAAKAKQDVKPFGASPQGKALLKQLDEVSKGGKGKLIIYSQKERNLAEEIKSEISAQKRKQVDFRIVDNKLRELRELASQITPEGATKIARDRINSAADSLESALENWVGKDVYPRQIYRESSVDKNKFVTKLGEALTAKEEIPFAETAGVSVRPQTALENTVFKDRESTNFAKELMGSDTVEKLGERHAVNQIQGLDSEKLGKWLANPKNEYIDAIPGLRVKISQYQKSLAGRERQTLANQALQQGYGIARSQAAKRYGEIANTLQKAKTAFRTQTPENIAKIWPEFRNELESTRLINKADLDLLEKDIYEAQKLASQEQRKEAIVSAVGKLAKKYFLPGGAIGGGAFGLYELYKNITG